MNQVLSDIKSIGGVVGSFLYDQKAGVLGFDAPGVFKPEKLAQVGRSLVKTFGAGNIQVKDLQDLVLQYEELLILARPVTRSAYLVVLCDPAINVNLLVMSLKLAMDEVRDAVECAATSAPPPHAPAPVSTAPRPADPPPSRKAEAASQPLGEPDLSGISLALAKVMGPMAGVVFGECVEEWRASNGGGPGAIEHLLAAIDREIGAPEKVAKFRSLVPRSLLES